MGGASTSGRGSGGGGQPTGLGVDESDDEIKQAIERVAERLVGAGHAVEEKKSSVSLKRLYDLHLLTMMSHYI